LRRLLAFLKSHAASWSFSDSSHRWQLFLVYHQLNGNSYDQDSNALTEKFWPAAHEIRVDYCLWLGAIFLFVTGAGSLSQPKP
jgi:hypothetical protein